MGITKRDKEIADSVVKQTLHQRLLPMMRELGMTSQQQSEVGVALIELSNIAGQGNNSLWNDAWTKFMLQYPYIAPIIGESLLDTSDLVEAGR